MNHVATVHYGAALVVCAPYLVEKSLKSPRRSHTRRPVREALLEYAGPMPFLVVPMLLYYKTQAKVMLKMNEYVH